VVLGLSEAVLLVFSSWSGWHCALLYAIQFLLEFDMAHLVLVELIIFRGLVALLVLLGMCLLLFLGFAFFFGMGGVDVCRSRA